MLRARLSIHRPHLLAPHPPACAASDLLPRLPSTTTTPTVAHTMVLSSHPARTAVTAPEPTKDGLPVTDIPIFTNLGAFRKWRAAAQRAGRSVGFVPTMGALHAGHLSLVKRSLAENDLTVLSIFVNPAQFAPHEDLATYPRTLPQDIAALETLSHVPESTDGSTPAVRTPSAVFLPAVKDMYPSGITQDVGAQKGTFIEVKGYGHQMEGSSRPTFFRGVATVVTKLFNAVEPTNAYFGQKDIQQALLLRRLVSDLLLSHPLPERLHIVPTARDASSGLALSSRNAYLTPSEMGFAPTLYAALRAGEAAWAAGAGKAEAIAAARAVVGAASDRAEAEGVELRLDYVQMNDSESFEVLEDDARSAGTDKPPVILSGAMWVGRTRLIDNVLLSEGGKILAV